MTAIAVVRVAVGVRRIAALAVGGVFGLTLSWSGMTDPEVLRKGLLFQNWYLMLFFVSALVTAFVGLRLLPSRALLTGEPLRFARVLPQRRHVFGAALFGIGWATADVCPGPIAAQLGQGVPWALATGFGLVLGVLAFNRRSVATEE